MTSSGTRSERTSRKWKDMLVFLLCLISKQRSGEGHLSFSFLQREAGYEEPLKKKKIKHYDEIMGRDPGSEVKDI